MDDPPPAARPALIEAVDLGFAHAGAAPLLKALTFRIEPGVTFVRGGDGRGKTTLLRLLAGEIVATSGALRHAAAPAWRADPPAGADDATVAREWLRGQRANRPGWDPGLESDLVDGFALAPHLDKALFMLSTGTRRKLGLVAAFAGDVPVALLDTPFAGLDARSRAWLAGLLTEAATHPRRAWVVADHAWPDGLRPPRFAAVVDLGD